MNLNLKSNRLLLQPMVKQDLSWLIDMFTDPNAVQYIYNSPPTEEDIISEMDMAIRRAGDGAIGIWRVLEIESKEFIGTALLLPLPIYEDDTNWKLVYGQSEFPDEEIEIGYILKKSAWGKGYATEIASRLLKFAFEETPLEEIVAVIDSDNIDSRKVLEKLNFVDEGLRDAYATNIPGFRITRNQCNYG